MHVKNGIAVIFSSQGIYTYNVHIVYCSLSAFIKSIKMVLPGKYIDVALQPRHSQANAHTEIIIE